MMNIDNMESSYCLYFTRLGEICEYTWVNQNDCLAMDRLRHEDDEE